MSKFIIMSKLIYSIAIMAFIASIWHPHLLIMAGVYFVVGWCVSRIRRPMCNKKHVASGATCKTFE